MVHALGRVRTARSMAPIPPICPPIGWRAPRPRSPPSACPASRRLTPPSCRAILFPVISALAPGRDSRVARAVAARRGWRRGAIAAPISRRAEKPGADAVAQNPADPGARYNLSLALAQQNRWDLADGPRHRGVRAGAGRRARALAVRPRGGKSQAICPEPLAAFSPSRPAASSSATPRLTRRLADLPGSIAAAVLVALAIGLLIPSAPYRSRSQPPGPPLRLDGAHRRACCSPWPPHWSDSARTAGPPTPAPSSSGTAVNCARFRPEADTTQKTSTLAPGSIAVIDQTFLGWVRLSFANLARPALGPARTTWWRCGDEAATVSG